jgi:hypothetical protein
MESLIDHFPVYEANQVLTCGPLNDSFGYLYQQERQARSHLVGIGIVCGLEIGFAGTTVTLNKGCGVTSDGYLIVEPVKMSLVGWRPYTLPTDIDYPPFKKGTEQFAMWELFGPGVSNTTSLASPPLPLGNAAVLLFLELKKEPLRNCSPNSCDDKGAQVIATVRRLLIEKKDLDAIIAAANALGGGLTGSDLQAALRARLNLPDLRLGRFDVPATRPVTSNDVYMAFLDIVRDGGLAQATANALSAAYAAFKPLLAGSYPADPFVDFKTAYGFLDKAPADTAQVRFLQYYADLFDDLLCAYDEFRWKGQDLVCACCPDDGLFPRHLMLGLLHPETVSDPAIYREGWLPSPAASRCASATSELQQLFARLVEMAARFTNAPALPKAGPNLPLDPQIRVTPSKRCCGAGGLEDKAIPYYYAQDGKPALYQLWSPVKTARRRANQNLSYNASLYADPPAPDFVIDPLRYDIDRYDFFRIEGHLGKNYQDVMQSLLTLRSRYRLPIDVIALRTGAYDDSQPVDLDKESARFQDLESLYEALRGDLMAGLAEGVMQFYGEIMPAVEGLTLNAGTPKLPLLQQYAPHFGFPEKSVGSWYEFYLSHFETQGYIDVDQNAIDPSTVLRVYCTLFSNTIWPDSAFYPHVVAIYYISKLAESVPPTLASLDYADFENRYQDLMGLIRFLRSQAIQEITPDLKNFLPKEEFIDLCEALLMDCKLEAVKAVHDDYIARIGELKKRQFLSSFLKNEPGIQHKAGVPPGGTFILVYHGEPAAPNLTVGASLQLRVLPGELAAGAQTVVTQAGQAGPVDSTALVKAIGNISANSKLIANDDVSMVMHWLTGLAPAQAAGPGNAESDPATKIIRDAVADLANGIVIADFFLPYRLAGWPGIQYVLPKVPPTFSVTVQCTLPNGSASATIEAKGGEPPYDAAVDDGAWQPLSGSLQLTAGDHRIKLRDTDGTETPEQHITVAQPIVIGKETYTCDAEGRYTVKAPISGGTPPYQVNGKAALEISTDPTPSGGSVSVTVTDSKGCSTTPQFTHVCCMLPCAGIALARGYKFFIPDADAQQEYQAFVASSVSFKVEAKPGEPMVDLGADVKEILSATPAQLSSQRFNATVSRWIGAINKLIASKPELNQQGKAQWLTLKYSPAAPGAMGFLSIEHFECLAFDIQIEVSFALANTKQSWIVGYTAKGTTISLGDNAIMVPPFDGTITDRCAEPPASTRICAAPTNFGLKIVQDPASGLYNAQASVPLEGLTFLWESNGVTRFGNGPTFHFQSATSGMQVIILTAFDVNGCSERTALRFDISG